MKVLIACEESQTVCKAFRVRGHEAYSCDIKQCSGGHPEWHIPGDCLKILGGGWGCFVTQDGKAHRIDGRWDLIVAHPPCTYLSNAATRHFSLRITPPEKVVDRWKKRAEAAVFFMQCMLAPCDRIAVENPVGFMNTTYRRPDQIIQPWQFAKTEDEMVTKTTCLWLKGLPTLVPVSTNEKPDNFALFGERIDPHGIRKSFCWTETRRGSVEDKQKARSKTFEGIAAAMAEQWG